MDMQNAQFIMELIQHPMFYKLNEQGSKLACKVCEARGQAASNIECQHTPRSAKHSQSLRRLAGFAEYHGNLQNASEQGYCYSCDGEEEWEMTYVEGKSLKVLVVGLHVTPYFAGKLRMRHGWGGENSAEVDIVMRKMRLEQEFPSAFENVYRSLNSPEKVKALLDCFGGEEDTSDETRFLKGFLAKMSCSVVSSGEKGFDPSGEWGRVLRNEVHACPVWQLVLSAMPLKEDGVGYTVAPSDGAAETAGGGGRGAHNAPHYDQYIDSGDDKRDDEPAWHDARQSRHQENYCCEEDHYYSKRRDFFPPPPPPLEEDEDEQEEYRYSRLAA